MQSVALGYHEFTANFLFDEHGLQPFFAADARVKSGGGSQRATFENRGEKWTVKLYYQDSGLVHPGSTTPQGTDWKLDDMREFRLKISRHFEEDQAGQQNFNAHIAPRWQGMTAEKNGQRREISVPAGLEEGINVRLSGSNIAFGRYEDLLRDAARAVGINGWYFEEPHSYSNVQDAERYVRLHRDASGPVHARDGPIAQMAHLLENDRSGYRKLVQNDDDERGTNLPGYYHTVTLGEMRIKEAFPSHELPKEIKHYYAREAADRSDDDPLAHPKLGASYQVSRADGSLGVDELEKLNRELCQSVLSVLADAGIDIAPQNGSGDFVESDAYWSPELTDQNPDPISLDLTEIRQEQESVVIRHLADGGFSPVEWEALEKLTTSGDTIAPKEIAEENGRHIDSVYRALDRLEDMVDRQYGEVALKSDYVSHLVYDAVSEARESTRRAVETAAKAKQAAERGVGEAMEKFVAWCARYGVDISNRRDALEVDLGELDPAADAPPERIISWAMDLWAEAGQDPTRLRQATVKYSRPGADEAQTKAWRLLR